MQSTDPKEWVTHAERDFRAMLHLRAQSEFVQQTLFYAHQSADLKALFFAAGREAPYSHDLRRLMTEIESDHPGVIGLAQACGRLNNDYTFSRYPVGTKSHPDVAQAVADSSAVRDFCRNLLKSYL